MFVMLSHSHIHCLYMKLYDRLVIQDDAYFIMQKSSHTILSRCLLYVKRLWFQQIFLLSTTKKNVTKNTGDEPKQVTDPM